MNSEWVWWLGALVATGVGAVLFMAMGRVPEIEDEPAPSAVLRPGAPPDDASMPGAAALPDGAALPEGDAAQRSPVSTTLPGADAPSTTSEIP